MLPMTMRLLCISATWAVFLRPTVDPLSHSSFSIVYGSTATTTSPRPIVWMRDGMSSPSIRRCPLDEAL